MNDDTKQPNGVRILAYVIGLLAAVAGGVYSMVELRFSPIAEKFDALSKLMEVHVEALRDDVDGLTQWRDAWAQRVLALDENQNGRHVACEREIERLRKHLKLP